MSTWAPSPKFITTVNVVANLIGCHQLITPDSSTFSQDFLLLIDKLQNQWADQLNTVFNGTMVIQNNLSTINFILTDLYSYLTSEVGIVSPLIISDTLKTPQALTVLDTLSTGTSPSIVTLCSLLQPNTFSTSYVNFAFSSVRLRYYPATPPYGILGLSSGFGTNGIQVYSDRVNILSDLTVKSNYISPLVTTGPYTPTFTTNPTGGVTFTTNTTTITQIHISFSGLTKSVARGTVFIQFGQGTNFGGTTIYAGGAFGNYAYDSPFNALVASNANGFPIFNDYMEQGWSLSGIVTLTKMGLGSGGGQLWALQVNTYSYNDNLSGVDDMVCFGTGYIEMSATYPAPSSLRINCYAGQVSAGTFWAVCV